MRIGLEDTLLLRGRVAADNAELVRAGCHPERESRDLGGRGAVRYRSGAPHAQIPRLTLGMTAMALTYAAAAPHPALRATLSPQAGRGATARGVWPFSPLDGEKVAEGRMRGVESLS